uniref:G protein-coupled receptor n=1 Tax=Ascaris lumbricoides TaxID=6252 RepID=A0A0M3I6K8_ASCLU
MTLMEAILTVNTALTSVLSVVPNTMVIVLACTTRVHEIRQYRWIIAAQSALEITTSVALSLLNLTLYNGRNGLLMFVCGAGVRHSIPLSVTIFAIYCVMVILGIFTHPLAFLYRYAYICSKERLKSLFTLRGAIILTSFFVTFSCLFAYGLWQRTRIAVYDAISYTGIEGTTVVISIDYEVLICIFLYFL